VEAGKPKRKVCHLQPIKSPSISPTFCLALHQPIPPLFFSVHRWVGLFVCHFRQSLCAFYNVYPFCMSTYCFGFAFHHFIAATKGSLSTCKANTLTQTHVKSRGSATVRLENFDLPGWRLNLMSFSWAAYSARRCLFARRGPVLFKFCVVTQPLNFNYCRRRSLPKNKPTQGTIFEKIS